MLLAIAWLLKGWTSWAVRRLWEERYFRKLQQLAFLTLSLQSRAWYERSFLSCFNFRREIERLLRRIQVTNWKTSEKRFLHLEVYTRWRRFMAEISKMLLFGHRHSETPRPLWSYSGHRLLWSMTKRDSLLQKQDDCDRSTTIMRCHRGDLKFALLTQTSATKGPVDTRRWSVVVHLQVLCYRYRKVIEHISEPNLDVSSQKNS
jgi:hypothetical protein